LHEHLSQLGKPKWIEKEGQEKAAIREISELAFFGLIKAYETAAAAPEFRHRNWFRDKATLDEIRSNLRFIKEIRTSGKQKLPTLIA
jgi:hypothetical protein